MQAANTHPDSEKHTGGLQQPSPGQCSQEMPYENKQSTHFPRQRIPRPDHLRTDTQKCECLTQSTPKANDDGYLTGWRLVIMAIAPCLAMFAVCLDNTIISPAIPVISAQFETVADIGWYGAAYLFTSSSTQILYGKVFVLYSAKWVLLVALFLFEVGSLVCAIAASSAVLIVGRALAGLGAAGLLSGAVIIAGIVVPLNKRPILVGIVSALSGIASISGPLIGGALTQKATWRWCFYINLPIGALAALIIVFFFNPPAKTASPRLRIGRQLIKLDLEGTALFIPSILCLLLALQWGGSKWPWGNGPIIGLFVASGVLGLGFLAVQVVKGNKATLPPRLLKDRSVITCLVCIFSITGAFYTVVYYVVQEASPLQSGVMMLPTLISMSLAAVVGGASVSVLGYYTPFLTLGAALVAVGSGLMTNFHPGVPRGKWIGFQIIFGSGLGLAVQQPIIAMQASLPEDDIPMGNAIMFFAQTLGGFCFLTAAQNIFSGQLVKQVTDLEIQGLNATSIGGVGATQIRNLVPTDMVPAFLEAYNESLIRTFYLATACAGLAAAASLLVPWNSVKGTKNSIKGSEP